MTDKQSMAAQNDDTICALATPSGTGGIGVIRVSGPGAFTIADSVSARRGSKNCADYNGHTLHRVDITEMSGEVIDDVLLAVFHAPRSYTGEDVVEISAHGGLVPLRRIVARLLESGARLARPGEFTQRAFLNGKMDLAQAEAVGDIIAAQTEQAHRQARRQSAGHLSRAVTEVRAIVLGVLAQIEASIDFPEDVGELDTGLCLQELAEAAMRIETLIATADSGILQREGVKVVLAGRPNVGKSSLLNALLQIDRAIVTPIPGTTRDVIEETLNLRGIPLRLTDTAGLRETDDEVERIGVGRTRESLADADLIVLMLDAVDGETLEDAELRAELADHAPLIVWNKWDLLSPDLPPPTDGIAVSAVTRWNLPALEEALASRILGDSALTTDGAAVSHARHKYALESARAYLHDAIQTLEAELPADFVSIDVRGSLESLGLVTGETATEDILAEIFSKFCIGK